MSWFTDLAIYWIIIFIQLYFLVIKYKNVIFSPIVIFPFIVTFYIIYGNLALEYYKVNLDWYLNIDPSEGNIISLISLIFMNLVLIFPNKRDKIKIVNKFYYLINLRKYDNTLLYFCTFSVFLNLIFYFVYVGDIPILRGQLNGYERFSIVKKVPSLIAKCLNVASFCITICILRLFIDSSKRVLVLSLLFVNTIFAFGLGNRQNIVFPIINTFFFLVLLNKENKLKIISLGLIIPVLGALGSIFRGDTKSSSVENLKFYLGGEYADFIRMRFETIPLQYGKTLLSIFFNIIPKQFYEVLGLEKENYSIYSAYLMKDIWGAETGQRVGIWGEFYINFGDIGVFFGFILMGVLLRYFYYLSQNNPKDIKQKFILSYLYVLVIFSIIASWGTIGDDLGSYGLCYFVFTLMIFKKVVKSNYG